MHVCTYIKCCTMLLRVNILYIESCFVIDLLILNILTEDSHKGSSNNERYTGCCIEKYQRLLTSYPVKNQQGSLDVNEHNSKNIFLEELKQKKTIYKQTDKYVNIDLWLVNTWLLLYWRIITKPSFSACNFRQHNVRIGTPDWWVYGYGIVRGSCD